MPLFCSRRREGIDCTRSAAHNACREFCNVGKEKAKDEILNFLGW